MGDETISYIAPDPTPEQLANAAEQGLDPYDRGGSLPYWDIAPDDCLAAPATIHDEMYMRGGDDTVRKMVDSNFSRDCFLCAKAADGVFTRMFEYSKACLFTATVATLGRKYWVVESRNTPITEAQGEAFIITAKLWINSQAAKIGADTPYPYIGPMLPVQQAQRLQS